MYLIRVSSGYHEVQHGPWRDKALAERTADQWNRVFGQRGWRLNARVMSVLDKSAATRDRLAALLVEMTERTVQDELLRGSAVPCECRGMDVKPGTVDVNHPGGVCFCGHDAGEHDGEEQCDGMVVPDSARAAQGRRRCVGCGRSGGELTENGCPSCGPLAEIRQTPEAAE